MKTVTVSLEIKPDKLESFISCVKSFDSNAKIEAVDISGKDCYDPLPIYRKIYDEMIKRGSISLSISSADFKLKYLDGIKNTSMYYISYHLKKYVCGDYRYGRYNTWDNYTNTSTKRKKGGYFHITRAALAGLLEKNQK